ncbi:MAG: hypothetical protein ACTHJ8_06995 [Mucilaginibacter sp.]|jgi:hypothetical protein
MNIHQYAGSANAQQDALTRQVNLFLFDLKNEACEHGFQSADAWTIQMASNDEMTLLKKQHHPFIALHLYPDALLNVFLRVKLKMQQPLSKQEMSLTISDLTRDNFEYLAAYPYEKAL